jgi:hypothetical protein
MNIKKTAQFLCIVLFFLFSLPNLVAGTITLNNPYNGVAYFLTLSSNANDYQDILADPGTVANIFSVQNSRIRYIPPYSQAYEVDTFDQSTLIIGFVEELESVSTPVFAFILEEATSDQVISLSDDFFLQNPETNTAVNFGFSKIPSIKPIKIDGAFLDWIDIDNLLSYARDSRPISFRQSSSDGSLAVESSSNISNSIFWQLAGTQVNELAAIRDFDNYYFKITAFSEIKQRNSYLFYVYSDDSENKYTIEIPVLAQSGPVILWDSTRLNPQLIGDYTTSSFGVEIRIDSQSLPNDFIPEDGQGPLIEFASFYFEGAVSEEFLLGTFNFSRIPRYDEE